MDVLRKAFKKPLHPEVSKFSSSIQDDQALVDADITGSVAHTRMLAARGLISPDDADKICSGLQELRQRLSGGREKLDAGFEDVHMFVEKRLEQIIGAPALLLHTARSRNDQVALDLRLFVRARVKEILAAFARTQLAMLDAAQKNMDAIMPGYTHLQRAQPVLFAHAMHSFVEMLERDCRRFQFACRSAAVSPLGAGAIAGTSLPASPEYSAHELDLPEVFANSMDAVSDRDFAADFLYACAVTAIHLSQIAESMLIWSTKEFAFMEFDDSVTTTSSLMPQKKNVDPLELIRGGAGAAIGGLVNLMVVLKGLPLGYNRDLQQTKPPVILASQCVSEALGCMSVVVAAMCIKPGAMRAAASDPEMTATDLVEYLVRKKVPFRKAHDIVSELVRHAREQSVSLPNLPIQDYQKFCAEFAGDLYGLFDPEKSIAMKASSGSTNPELVRNALKAARAKISGR